MNMLPDKGRNNNNKRKRTNEKRLRETQRMMSISHKRKLNKLKEEKENDLVLSKSVEALEKYKIPEAARALLQSSQNIGQVESRKVKRSKGLLHLKLTSHASSESEPESEITQSTQDQSLMVQKNTSTCSDSSTMLLCGTRPPDIHNKSLPEDGTSSMDHNWSESINFMDKVEESPESSCSSKLPAPSILKDPKNRRHVSRPSEVVKARSDIPIIMMEQEIMEAINEKSTVIIRGETGCGKTTQVPQFLYEVGIGSSVSPLGSCILGVTQPRRIAVYATASRVAYELGVRVGEEVGYQVRYDKKIGKSCSINFMTDGILLRELQGDFWLKRYSVIILDEVHERNLSTDTLIGMLSRVIICRQKEYERQQEFLQQYSHLGISIDREKLVFPLKLVLTSATMPVEDFISYRKLFPDPPQEINVLSRQFKVDIQFSTTTKADYTKEACKKVLEIHKNMPQGGILVFVLGSRGIV